MIDKSIGNCVTSPHIENQTSKELNQSSDEGSQSSTESAAINTVLSVVFPRTRRSVPIHVPEHEGVNLTGRLPYFCLFMCLTLIFTSAIVLFLISICALVWKKKLMLLLSQEKTDELLVSAILSLLTSIASFYCCWLIWIIQFDYVIQRRLLLLLQTILGIILVILACSLYLSLEYRININITTVTKKHPPSRESQHENVYIVLEKCDFKISLNRTLYAMMKNYNIDSEVTAQMDELQSKFSCCGLDSYKDWLHFCHEIPNSCCHYRDKHYECSKNKLHSIGCLHAVSTHSAWWASALSGYASIMITFISVTFILTLYLLTHAMNSQRESLSLTSLTALHKGHLNLDQSFHSSKSTIVQEFDCNKTSSIMIDISSSAINN